MALVNSKTSHLIFILSFLLLLSGCGKSFNPTALEAHGNIKVLILGNNNIKAANYSNEAPYEFQVVELLQVYDLISLTGKFVRFYTKANNNGGVLRGSQPKAHFFKSKKGYFNPKDSFSMELAALYFHTQNLAQLDEKIGARDLNILPRKIILDTPLRESALQDNNAIYDGKLDAIIYLPHKGPDLNLTLNSGIFAHEYFHSLFYKLLQIPLDENPLFKDINSPSSAQLSPETMTKLNSESTAKIKFYSSQESLALLAGARRNNLKQFTKQNFKDYYEFLFKGLNEGIADYWGWSYTQDINFIKHSLPGVEQSRALDLKSHNLNTVILFTREDLMSLLLQSFSNDAEKSIFITAFSYQIGTRFALLLKELTQILAEKRTLPLEQAKIIIMTSIVQFLKQFGTTLKTANLNPENMSLLSPQDLILEFSKFISLKNIEECQILLTSFESDINNFKTKTCLKTSDSYSINDLLSAENKNEK